MNEEGSEAAAVTALIMTNRSAREYSLPARFDRPFVFFIKDEETGLLLFQGRLVKPKKAAA